MTHNPVKKITMEFHDANGITPKQEPLPQQPPISNGMGAQSPAPPQTKLDPLSETLFQGWGHANGMDSSVHSAPDNHYDFRGMFKQMNGQVQPPGRVSGAADTYNRLMQSKPDYAGMGIQEGQGSMGGQDPNSMNQSDPLSALRAMMGR